LAGAGAARQDPGADLAATLGAAALDAPVLHVVDDPAAADGAAAGLGDLDVAGEHHGLGLQVVVDVGGGGVDRAAAVELLAQAHRRAAQQDRKSTRLNSSHVKISYAVFCLKKKNEATLPEQ